MHVYKHSTRLRIIVRLNLISDVLPFGRLCPGLGSDLKEFIACMPASEAK